MTAIPLGRGAYLRLYTGSPEVKLLNRWLEQNPANLIEGSSVLGRPGTTEIAAFDASPFAGFGSMRGNYTLSGLFNDALFVVCGPNLFRVDQDMTITHIQGVISGTGHPEVTWQKGAGYERLWISDGLVLQYYSGNTFATGTLTLTGSIVNGSDTIELGGIYYTWGTTFSPSDAGTSSNPYVVNPKSDPLGQLLLALNGTGTPSDDYSSTIGGANTYVSAQNTAATTPASSLTLQAVQQGQGGNSITTTVTGGEALTFSNPTLTNGGIDVLQGCEIPDGQAALALCEVSSYVLVSISGTQKFYWVNPGEVTIDPLNFASKESSPDNITAMRTLGDQVGIIGDKSFENWYATGDSSAPFAPIEGRVYARGAYSQTAVVIDDAIVMVGDDGRVYSVGYQAGDNTDATWGVSRISNNGIEERIRRQIRREQGLNP